MRRLMPPLVALLLLVACDDGLFHPAADAPPVSVALALPSLETFADGPARSIGDAFLRVDRVRIRLQGSGSSEPLFDQTLPVTADQELQLRVEVPLEEFASGLNLQVEMLRGTDLLFLGGGPVTLERGRATRVEVIPVPVPARIELPPAPPPLASLGDSVRLMADVVFATGDVIPGLEPTWVSLDPEVVTVSGDGVAVAVAPGTARVEARFEGLTAVQTVEVRLVAVSLEVEPASLTLQEGASAPLTATARDARGNLFTPDRLQWSSLNPTIASVSQGGEVTALLPGLATIRASQDGAQAEVPVVVLPRADRILVEPEEVDLGVGTRLQLSVTVLDPRGNPILPPEVEWSSSDPTVATVSASGEVLGVAVGEVEVRASRDGVVGAALVRVIQVASSIEIRPPSLADLRVTETATLEAIVLDGVGNRIDPPEVEWSSSNPLVATVNQAGVVTGVTPGTVQIRASRDEVEAFASVTVIERIPRVLATSVTTGTGADGQVLAEFRAEVETFGFPGEVEFLIYGDTLQLPLDSTYVSYSGAEEPVTLSTGTLDLSNFLLHPGLLRLRAGAFNTFGFEVGAFVPFAYLPAPMEPYAWFMGEEEGIEVSWFYDFTLQPDLVFQIQRRPMGATLWTAVVTTPGEPGLEDPSYRVYIDTSADPEVDWEYRLRACLPGLSACSAFSPPSVLD
jgi:uncharacterized protein YjdB